MVGIMADDTKRPQTLTPMGVKVVYTAFMAVLVPVYLWHYGPTNFLYFCDVALLLTLVGVWTEKPLLVSLPAVGILAPQVLWVADFVANLFGAHLTGMTDYMFNAQSPLFLRGLSLFHGWLPFLLVYLVWRLGYDRRALIGWTVLAWGLLAVCYFAMPGPMADAGMMPVNINYVFGMSDAVAQTWMPGWAWFAMLLVVLPVVLFWPTHLVLSRLFGRGDALAI
jgi:hypothetical protein